MQSIHFELTIVFFFGNIKTLSLSSYKDLNKKEIALFSVLIFVLLLMGIFPFIFLDNMFIDCVNILEHAKCGRIL